MIIAIDFDGTIVEHMYPEIGNPVPGAMDQIFKWYKSGHSIILWTMRSGIELEEAKQYISDNGIKLFGVNENPKQTNWTSSPKAYANLYIDDAAYGCPLIPGVQTTRPMVDWSKIKI